MSHSRAWIDLKEAACLAGVPLGTLQYWVRNNEVTSTTIDRVTCVKIADVERRKRTWRKHREGSHQRLPRAGSRALERDARWLRIRDIVSEYGLPERTIYRWVKCEKPPTIRKCGILHVDKHAVEMFVSQRGNAICETKPWWRIPSAGNDCESKSARKLSSADQSMRKIYAAFALAGMLSRNAPGKPMANSPARLQWGRAAFAWADSMIQAER